MSPKKRTAKKPRSKRPTKAMLQEISEVFEKYNWTGVKILPVSNRGITNLSEAVTNMECGVAPTPESLNCIPPQKPKRECRTCPDGSIVCGWVCD